MAAPTPWGCGLYEQEEVCPQASAEGAPLSRQLAAYASASSSGRLAVLPSLKPDLAGALREQTLGLRPPAPTIEGVQLRYAGTGTFDGRSVQSIRVDDRKFGRIFAAHFDADDALLAAVEEELSEREAEWFRNQRGNQGRRSPAWTTRFEKYEEIQGVLWPTKWCRTGGSSARPFRSELLHHSAERRLQRRGAEPAAARDGVTPTVR